MCVSVSTISIATSSISCSDPSHDMLLRNNSKMDDAAPPFSTKSSTCLLSPSPGMITPPRLSSQLVNSVPQAPPRRRLSSTNHSAKIDPSHQFSEIGRQHLPEMGTEQVETFLLVSNNSNGYSRHRNGHPTCAFSSNETMVERVALLPDDYQKKKSSPPRNKPRPNHPTTPSSRAASHSSPRFSPTSSVSRSLSSGSWTSSASLPSSEPLSPPSSSSNVRKFPTSISNDKDAVACSTIEAIYYHARDQDDLTDNSSSSSSSNSQIIMARLAAKEQYHQQKQRLRQLFQHRLNPGGDDDSSLGVFSSSEIARSTSSQQVQSRNSSSSNISIYNNNLEQQQHEQHEIVINPKSIEGTLESASFHLHGQIGGRKQIDNPDLKNAAMMNGHVLKNVNEREDPRRIVVDDTFDTNVGIDFLENGVNIISDRGGHNNIKRNSTDGRNHQDFWSTGVAAAVVMGTASRYHKTFCMFPHGRKVILPIIMGILAFSLSIVTLMSCRLMTILPDENNSYQVFQLGPWNYLSPGKIYDGEVCLPYPSDMEVDIPFMIARMSSVLASCLGGGLLLLTMTLMCIPCGRQGIRILGLGYIFSAILQVLTMVHYQTKSCNGSGYFRGIKCEPNQDLVFCLAASVLYLACGWILYMVQKFVVAPPGHAVSQIYTWSAKSKSSNERKGILRTIEKCWTKIPSGDTLVATVFVERRKSRDGKIKTTHTIQTDVLTD